MWVKETMWQPRAPQPTFPSGAVSAAAAAVAAGHSPHTHPPLSPFAVSRARAYSRFRRVSTSPAAAADKRRGHCRVNNRYFHYET